MKFFDVIANALFPNKCICCGEIIDKDDFLCDYCYEMIEYVDFSKICKRCGLDKKECQCKNRVFHFGGSIAPFVNKEVARKSMYRFKFGKTFSGSKFFAFEMAKAVKTVYNDIEFDGIAFVPMHFVKRLKRGFNQSQVLARELSKILDLKIFEGLLSSKYSPKIQHETPFKERFSNIKGRYKFNYNVTGKRILLVDDIKTTGASLDECAKQLLLAGADNVYCVTGLITQSKKGKKINGN